MLYSEVRICTKKRKDEPQPLTQPFSVRCKLCGISFNISRIRTSQKSLEAVQRCEISHCFLPTAARTTFLAKAASKHGTVHNRRTGCRDIDIEPNAHDEDGSSEYVSEGSDDNEPCEYDSESDFFEDEGQRGDQGGEPQRLLDSGSNDDAGQTSTDLVRNNALGYENCPREHKSSTGFIGPRTQRRN